MSRFVLAAVALITTAALALPGGAAQAQTYPSKPIRLVLPYVPGGIIDTAGRHFAQRLSESLGQPVVAENRPGAGGMVGADVVARSAPDGYTILLTDPALVSNPTLQKDPPYDLSRRAGGLDRRLLAGGDRRVPAPAGEDVRRAHRLRQGQSRQAQLRLRRHRHRAASRRRDDQAAHRHRHDARALSRHRRGLSRCHERQGAARRSRASPAPCRSPATTGCGRSPPPAPRAAAVYPDVPTVAESAARLRRRPVDRHLRARPGCRRRCSPSSTARSRRCCSIPS